MSKESPVSKKKNKSPAAAASPAPVPAPSTGLEGWPQKAFIGILACLTLLFFLPFIAGNGMIFGSDTLNGIYAKFFYSDFVRTHHSFPRLLSVTLSGMPTLDAFMGDMFYPLAALQFFLEVPRALGYKYLFTVFMAGVFMFLFLSRALGLRKDVSFFGATAFMFSTQFVSLFYPGHDGKTFVISLLPLSLFGLKRLLDTRQPLYVAILALSIGCSLLTSHVQTTYFTLWGLFAYFCFETIRGFLSDRERKKAVARGFLFAGAVGLGLAVGMIQFLPPYMFTKSFSVRGEGEKTSYEHAASWSMHPEEAASLLVPEFCGFQDKDGGQGVAYWGKNPFKLNNEYAGIVVLILAVFFFLLFRRDRFVLFWGGVAIAALIFALGATTPFFYLFYYLVPGVKLFRAPSMIMFWFAAAAVIIAAWGLNRLLTETPAPSATPDRLRQARNCLVALLILTGLTLFISAAQGAVLSIWRGIFGAPLSPDQVQAFQRNYGAFIKGAWFSLLFGGGALFALSLFLKDSLKPVPLVVLLTLIGLCDLIRTDSYFYHVVNPSDYIRRDEPALLDLAAKAKQERFRVLPVPGHLGQSDAQLYGLESVLGFHDNELKVYRAFTGGQNRDNLFYGLQQGKIEGNPFLDLLNVRYVLFRPGQGRPVAAAPNPTALPRAFCVAGFEVLPDSQVTARLRDPAFPYRSRLLLSEAPAGIPAGDTSSAPCGRVEGFTVDGEDRIVKAVFDRPGFLVLSEIHIPYWKARVNGENRPVHKADLALMAVPLPAGSHTVVFSYESPWIRKGARITLLGLAICIFLILMQFTALKRRTVAPVLRALN